MRVVGVLENALGPKQGLILGRLEGGPLEKHGRHRRHERQPGLHRRAARGRRGLQLSVRQGDDRGHHPHRRDDRSHAPHHAAGRLGSLRPSARSGRAVPAAGPRGRHGGASAPAARDLPRGAGAARGAAGGRRAPAPGPAPRVLGLRPRDLRVGPGRVLDPGLRPRAGDGASGAARASPCPTSSPEARWGVSLIEGDLDLSVTGTITHIEDGRVYAFGHPFYNLGPIQFPMKKAYVYSVFPSLYQSWKISTATDAVGTVDQDRTTAIAGRLGATPHMIPVEVKLASSRGGERRFAFRMVEDELFSPVLAYVSLLSVLQGNERAFGTSTVRVDARIGLAGGREVRVAGPVHRDAALAAGGGPRGRAPRLPADNDFEKVTGGEARARGLVRWRRCRARPSRRVWLERTGPAAAGLRTPPSRCSSRPGAHDTVTETIPFAIPQTRPRRQLHPARVRRRRP